jgi:hypothetical protein
MDFWLAYTVEAEDVGVFVQHWFREQYSKKPPKEMIPLREFLGLTRKEYDDWILNHVPFEVILQARRASVCAPAPSEGASTTSDSLYAEYGD